MHEKKKKKQKPIVCICSTCRTHILFNSVFKRLLEAAIKCWGKASVSLQAPGDCRKTMRRCQVCTCLRRYKWPQAVSSRHSVRFRSHRQILLIASPFNAGWWRETNLSPTVCNTKSLVYTGIGTSLHLEWVPDKWRINWVLRRVSLRGDQDYF